MKIRKTRQDKRGTYTFRFQDGSSCVIRPGEKGVTETDIRLLHSFDDHEVYSNCRNGHPPITEEEKAVKREWEAGHPGEKYPVNWNLSLDYLPADEADWDGDKRKIQQCACVYRMDENPAAERLQELMETMTERQREVFRLAKLEGYSLTETAVIIGTSIANVSKHLNKAVEHIRKYL